MNSINPKGVMVMLSIVEMGKGKRLIEVLERKNIAMHMQTVGHGTAPTEMMDIFGLGSNDKDIVISLAAEKTVKELMADFGGNFESHSKYGGLMIMLKINAVNRLVAEALNHNIDNTEPIKAGENMKNEHRHNLVMITVNRGYTDEVMEVAKRAGATGGTVIRGRVAQTEEMDTITNNSIEEERESILILAPAAVGAKIMESVNEKFGIRSEAGGVLCAMPVEKAYKI